MSRIASVCYAFMMSIECEDQIDIFEYNLQEANLETLNHLLSLTKSCKDCNGCDGQIKMLERLIANKQAQN